MLNAVKHLFKNSKLYTLNSKLYTLKTDPSYRQDDKSASKGNFQIKSGTVSETVSVSSNRGTEWRLFERVCHTLPVVREASCSIPDIGTLRHERRVCDGRRMLQSNL